MRRCLGIWCPGAPEGPLLRADKSPYCFRGDHYLIFDDHTKELVPALDASLTKTMREEGVNGWVL